MIERETSITDVAAQMTEQRSPYAVVIDRMMPIGLVTERDLLRYASSQDALPMDPIWRVYQTHFPILIQEASLRDAATMMEQHGVHQVVIADESGKLIGLLARHDLLQALHGSYFEYLIRQVDSKTIALTEIKDIYAQLLLDKERIAKSEAKFHTLFELLHDAVVIIDPNTRVAVEFNSVAAQQLGYTREAFSQLRIDDYNAIEKTEEIIECIKAIFKHGGQYDFETKHRHKNGSLLIISACVTPIMLED